jgi:hypothetical protein
MKKKGISYIRDFVKNNKCTEDSSVISDNDKTPVPPNKQQKGLQMFDFDTTAFEKIDIDPS